MSTPALGAIIVAATVLLVVIWIFNRLISLKVRTSNAWSDIDVQLKRRADLVPSLVQTVRGYAAHENTTLQNAIAARNQAGDVQSPAERGRIEAEMSRQLTKIIALSEAYPDLKADELFRSLHNSLVEIEDNIQSARRYYNAVVRDYNTMLRQFPQSMVAAAVRMQPREFFELENAAEANAPVVDLKKES
jgi:LemA protein